METMFPEFFAVAAAAHHADLQQRRRERSACLNCDRRQRALDALQRQIDDLRMEKCHCPFLCNSHDESICRLIEKRSSLFRKLDRKPVRSAKAGNQAGGPRRLASFPPKETGDSLSRLASRVFRITPAPPTADDEIRGVADRRRGTVRSEDDYNGEHSYVPPLYRTMDSAVLSRRPRESRIRPCTGRTTPVPPTVDDEIRGVADGRRGTVRPDDDSTMPPCPWLFL